jgi:hypothetical protein
MLNDKTGKKIALKERKKTLKKTRTNLLNLDKGLKLVTH